MKINLTLIVQLIHFILTWKILKNFILKPVHEELEKRDKTEHESLNALKEREIYIAQHKEIQKQELKEFQKQILQNYPMPLNPVITLDLTTSYTRNEKEIETLTAKIKNLIVQKVPRVRS